MTELFRHAWLGLRALGRRPGFTAVVVLSLALALAANTTVFSLMNAVLLRDLPYRDPERIAILWNQFPATHQLKVNSSLAELIDLRASTTSFEELAVAAPNLSNLTGAGEPELLVSVRSSANLFRLLGVEPAAGRFFIDEEELPGRGQVVVISHGLWTRRFGADPSIVGRTITLDGSPRTVVGVLPEDFYFRRKGRDLWVPQAIDSSQPRESRSYELYGRLKPGVTLQAAAAELALVANRFRTQYPDAYDGEAGYTLVPKSYKEEIVGSSRGTLVVVAVMAGLVLLIACANIANLLLARAATRERELALRAALGSSRGALARQFLVEGLLLSGLGGAAGLLGAWWSIRSVARLNPGKIPRVDEVSLDGPSLLFTALMVLAIGLFFGLVPIWKTRREDFVSVLKEGARGSSGAAHQVLRRALLVGEVALALAVVVWASLLVASLAKLERIKPGFDPKNVLTFELRLSPQRFAQPSETVQFWSELRRGLAALPGVESVAGINAIPLGVVEWTGSVGIEGDGSSADAESGEAAWRGTTPDYFRTLRIPISGREFTDGDLPEAQAVGIVDQKFAAKHWPGESPLGKRFRLVGQGAPDNWRTVVGVAGNVKHRDLEGEGRETVYVPLAQFPSYFSYIAVRTAGDASVVAEPARLAVQRVDADQAIFRVETLQQKLDTLLGWRHFYTLVVAAFALVALTLSVVGVYSLMSYQAAQRTREIGIRMALGAVPGEVRVLVLRQGLALAGLGVALGIALALAAGRLLASVLYGISAFDLWTYGLVAAGILALAALACFLPARRATRVDPKVALSTEA